MTEPVVDLELQPGRDQGVGAGGDDQPVPGQQSGADQPGTGLQHGRQRLGIGLRERNVPPEPGATRTHSGFVQVVPAPVVAAGLFPSRLPALGRRLQPGVEQVLGSQLGTNADEQSYAERRRELCASRICGR